MNNLTDQEVFNTITKITDTKNLFSMTGFSFKESPYKNKRAELIAELVKGINLKRVGTEFKPITERWLAIKCNKNPFLKLDAELELIKKHCERVGNYKKLFWVLK